MPFKKIFKPIRKVLDKVIPNEIKPALPYIAAVAPFMLPPGMGPLMRASIAGGLNIGSQLAQEGTTEDDLNLMSAGIAAATGALSAPGTSEKLQSMKFGERTFAEGIRGQKVLAGLDTSNLNALQKAANLGLTGASKAAKFLSASEGSGGVGDILRPGGTPMGLDAATATAVAVPATQATGDAMYTDAVIAQKQQIIDDALAQAELLEDAGARGDAIRNAMKAYGFFTDDEIESTVSSAGYRAGGRVGFKFGGIDKAIEMVEKQTVEKGKEGIMQAAGEDPMLVEEYNKYVFDLMEQRPNAKPMSFQDFKKMIKAGFKSGGRVGFKDGSSTGNFGMDRYLAEILESGSFLDRGEDFMNKADDIVKEGKLDSRMFDMLKEYKNLQKEEEAIQDKFKNEEIMNKAEETLDKDFLEYYGKKIKDLEKREDDLIKQEEGIMALEKKTNFDASEITRTPDFQNWLRLYETDRSKAYDHPYSEIYENILFVKLKGRDKSFFDLETEARKAAKFADGGLMNLGGKEMDLRGGGFVPIGKKERADDVPARLSKNEFVMTADAVRAAGGGSVNKGAKRMYDLMNNLEARA